MIDTLLNKAIEQGRKLQMLSERVDRVNALSKPGQRVLHFMKASYRVKQSDNTPQSLVFQNTGALFEAHRLVVYPQVRLFAFDTSSQGETERTFRPTWWLSAGAQRAQLRVSFDAFVDITYNGKQITRSYQNAPFAGSQLLSSQPRPKRATLTYKTPFSSYETPSGMVFDEPYALESGESLTLGVTPTFTGKRNTSVDSRIYEYEVVAILEGFKVIA